MKVCTFLQFTYRKIQGVQQLVSIVGPPFLRPMLMDFKTVPYAELQMVNIFFGA